MLEAIVYEYLAKISSTLEEIKDLLKKENEITEQDVTDLLKESDEKEKDVHVP